MAFKGLGRGNTDRISKKYKARLTENGKICTGCKEDKKLEDYNKNYSRCRDCTKKAYDEKRKRLKKNTYDWN